MEALTTELAVIGAGPGGYAAAFYAADLGMKVTLVDEGKALGGVCLNRGCIPSKALLHVARLLEEAREAQTFGIGFGPPSIDLAKLRSFKNDVVTRLNGGIHTLAKARKVAVAHGRARFLAPDLIEVTGGEGPAQLRFRQAIIATGSRPILPPALRLDSPRVLDSTGALELPDIPAEFLLVGGGIIGLELGSVYAALGSKVTVIEALADLATPVDRDLFRPLEKRLKERFKAVHLNCRVAGMEERGARIHVRYEQAGRNEEADFDRVLLCIGRRPNTENLGLENVGVALDERGFIKADKTLRTSAPNIFAIGDAIGNPMLAHKASREARVAVEALLGKRSVFDNVALPNVIYTDPEIAWVGLTENEAKKEGREHKVSRFPWAASGRALASGRSEGLTKVLFDPQSERLLGVGICGINAGELIAEATLALEMGCVVGDITGTIHAHPTLAETFMESAEAFHGLATHLVARK